MPRQQAEILPCSLKSIKSACALCSIYSSSFDTLVMPGPCCICCTVRQAKNDDDGGSSFFNRPGASLGMFKVLGSSAAAIMNG